MQRENEGLLLVVSGPSGAGKSTLLHRVMQQRENVLFSVSATTRAMREGEADGVDYHFISRECFLETLNAGGFLEHNSYSGNDSLYGTPLAPIRAHMEAGDCVFLDIDVNGARQVRGKLPEAILVFVTPPSMLELETRLRSRGTNTEAQIGRRMAAAAQELPQAAGYDYLIINDDCEAAAQELLAIVTAEYCRCARRFPYLKF